MSCEANQQLFADEEMMDMPVSGQGKNRRLEKKKKLLVLQGKGSKNDYFDVYGPESRVEVCLQPPKPNSRLSVQDLQNLVQWILADGCNPKWIFVKNKPLVTRVVMLHIPGLDAALYMAHQGSFRSLSECCGVPRAVAAAVGPLATTAQTLEAIFSCRKTPPGKTQTGASQNVDYCWKPQSHCSWHLHSKQQDLADAELLEDRNSSDLDTEEQRVKRRKGSNGDSLWNDSKSGAFPASYYTLTERQMHENGYPKPEIAEISSTKQNTLGFVRTRSAAVTSKPWEMVAIDCEMCCTSEGLELTRVSMVDPLGNVILDKLVKPKNAITNYNTRFSGITADMLQDVTTTLEDVREEILMVVSAEMILVGHSVENDLLALKIYHPLVIDTALLYQHPERGSSYKPALRALTSRFLRRRIQENKNGHDSIEDACAAMDLTLLKIKNGPAFGRRMKPYCENLIQVLSNHERSCTLIGNRTMLHHYAVGSCNAVLANSDNDVLARAEKEVRKASVDFLWLQFSELQSYYEGEAQNLKAMALHVAEMASLLTCNKGAKTSTKIKPCLSQDLQTVLTQLDDRIRRLHEALPLNSLMITFSGHGDTPGVRWLQELKWKSLQLPKQAGSERWTPHNEAVLEEYAAQAETTLAFVCTKT